MQKKKKGFTLVELLVVIAILAILAGVSVVGYLSFTKKAKESNDISLTTQMNTILQGEEATEGANKTAHDAVLDLKDNGLDVTKLTPTSEGYEFVYDLSQDKFFLLDGEKVVAPSNATVSANKTDIYKFVGKDGELSNTYSNYLKDDYISPETLEISTGFDSGTHKLEVVNLKSDSLTYANVRVDAKELVVETPKATIDFYGKIDKATVKSVDEKHSLHVYGEILSLDVTVGHIVVENGGNINTITDTSATADGSKATVEIKNNGIVGAVVSHNQNIVQGSKKPETSEVVNPTEVSKDFAGGIGTEASPYLISNISQFKKISTKNKSFFKLLNDIEFAFNDLVQVRWSGYNFYSNVCVKNFYGTLDGGNNIIKFQQHGATSTYEAYDSLFYNTTSATVKNIIIDSGTVTVDSQNSNFESIITQGKLTFENNAGTIICNAGQENKLVNCINRATINSSSYSAVFVGYTFDNSKLSFINCYNEGSYIGVKASMFVGNIAKVNTSLILNIRNCGNRDRGIVRTTTNDPNYFWNCYVSTGLEGKKNLVEIIVNDEKTDASHMLSSGFIKGPNDSNLALNVNADKTFTIHKSSYENVAKYEIVVKFYATSKVDGGTHLISVNETMDKFSTETKQSSIKYLYFTSNTDLTKVGTLCGWNVVSDGINQYYLFNESEYLPVDKAKPSFVTVYAYDDSGMILSVADCSL